MNRLAARYRDLINEGYTGDGVYRTCKKSYPTTAAKKAGKCEKYTIHTATTKKRRDLLKKLRDKDASKAEIKRELAKLKRKLEKEEAKGSKKIPLKGGGPYIKAIQKIWKHLGKDSGYDVKEVSRAVGSVYHYYKDDGKLAALKLAEEAGLSKKKR
jgi:hypothetical protein